jgi:plasmid maintenance system antidote protein VapI
MGLENVDADLSLPVVWREAFPPLDDTERPGRMLRAARTREDLTQMQLARLTGIPQRHLSAMEQGKRAIGKERAKKLAEVLHVDYRLFL